MHIFYPFNSFYLGFFGFSMGLLVDTDVDRTKPIYNKFSILSEVNKKPNNCMSNNVIDHIYIQQIPEGNLTIKLNNPSPDYYIYFVPRFEAVHSFHIGVKESKHAKTATNLIMNSKTITLNVLQFDNAYGTSFPNTN